MDEQTMAIEPEKEEVKNRGKETVPIGPIETIRNRLQMSIGAFSLALGWNTDGAYRQCLARRVISKQAALAAEALMRRQGASGDTVFLVRIVKGAPAVSLIEDCKEMLLDGVTYLLVKKE